MKFESERLEFRPWVESEADQFFALTQDKGFTMFAIANYVQKDLQSARAWVAANLELHRQRSLGKFGVWQKADCQLIGMSGLTPYEIEGEQVVDLTYRLTTAAWGKRFGSEMARATARHGFETLKLKEITATITPDNDLSRKIAEKLGFKLDRRILLMGVETNLFRLPRESFR